MKTAREPKTAGEARKRARSLARFNAFISLSDEEGAGTVIAVKDVIDVRGTVTTGGGIILPDIAADSDAAVVERARAAGCLVVGKTNLHEWAYGVTSDNPHYGPVRNPHDSTRVAGGSSGGSAVAVVGGACDWAMGTDTGGSIRIPASFCGVVGFKPTIGTFDTGGVFPLSPRLDTIGPLGPDVEVTARAFSQMGGAEPPVRSHRREISDFRVGIPRGWVDGLDRPTGEAWRRVSEGTPEIDFPSLDEVNLPGFTIVLEEAHGVHRKWLGPHSGDYGEDVLRLLLRNPGRGEYVRALEAQGRVTADVVAAMAGVDALLLPTTRVVAPRVGAAYERSDLTDFTRPFNTTGMPAVSIPVPGTSLPVGIQLVGHFGADAELLELARAMEDHLVR